MHLSPKETDRLLLFLAAELARKRRARGLKLNYPEARALIADEICEGARDGRSVAELMEFGATILTTDDVLPGVDRLVGMLQVEGVLRGRAEAGHGARADPRRASEPVDGVRARRGRRRRRRDRAQRGARDASRSACREHGRSPGSGRLALPLLRGQPGAAVRARARRSACISTSRRAPRSASSRGRSARSSSSRSAASASCTGSTG